MSHVVCHMSGVTGHMTNVTYHMTGVRCHMSCYIFVDKVVELVGGRSVINGAYPV